MVVIVWQIPRQEHAEPQDPWANWHSGRRDGCRGSNNLTQSLGPESTESCGYGLGTVSLAPGVAAKTLQEVF